MVLTRSRAVVISNPNSVKISRNDKVGILKATEFKLNRACQTVILLNDKIIHISRHYHRAKAANQRVFRYNLRVKLAVFEGVRNMFYEYCRDRAEDIAELRRELFNQRVTIITSSDREDMDEDDSDFDEGESDFDENEPDFDEGEVEIDEDGPEVDEDEPDFHEDDNEAEA